MKRRTTLALLLALCGTLAASPFLQHRRLAFQAPPGGGGGGPSWSDAPLLIYNPDAGVTLDTAPDPDEVSAWQSQGSDTETLTSSTSALRPAFVSSDSNFGGKPTLNYRAEHTQSSTSYTAMANFRFAMALRMSVISGNQCLIAFYSGNNNRWIRIYVTNGGALVANFHDAGDVSRTYSTANGTIAVSTNYVITGYFEGGTQKVWLNGSELTALTSTDTWGNGEDGFLNFGAWNTSTSLLNGQVGYAAIWNDSGVTQAEMSGTNYTELRDYFGW